MTKPIQVGVSARKFPINKKTTKEVPQEHEGLPKDFYQSGNTSGSSYFLGGINWKKLGMGAAGALALAALFSAGGSAVGTELGMTMSDSVGAFMFYPFVGEAIVGGVSAIVGGVSGAILGSSLYNQFC